MTRRQLARRLQTEHSQRSWREISQADYYGQIPAGTLARIAKSNGEYIPKKWRTVLGMGKAHTASQRPKRLADLSPAELLAAFQNRVEM